MSNGSEKVNKNTNIVTWFLTLFTLLVSVLILIIVTGHLELLESLEALLIDKPIITLLASMSLLSFLLQIYMYANPERIAEPWKKVIARFLLRPVLLVSVLMLVLILVVETGHPELLKSLRALLTDKPIIILLAGISLLSFLFQVYLYVDPERADKPWKKVVVRFLLWPVLLVSVLMLVLILSFEIWFPELLKSLRAFIPDIYKQIIAIITLLVSVSLFSLLLQRYMNKEPEKVAKIWKIIAYPVHFVIRLVARAVVLLAILLTVIMTPTFYPMYFAYRFDFFRFSAWLLLLLTILTTILISSLILISICIGIWNLELLESLWAFISNHWNNLNPKKEDLNIIMIIALLSGIGLFSFLLPKFIQDIKKSLSYIKEKIVEVLRDKWWPKIDIKESLKVTWHCYFARICPSIRETFAQSQKLFFALLLLCIISVCGYISVKELNKWQQDVEDSLVDIRTVTDTIKTDTAHLILLRSSGLSPAYLSKKENQISFSLIYPPQGNLISKKGICPEGDNLIWLQLFKQAILKCSEDSLMELQIQGFASAAPVLLNGYTTKSDSLNCEIANQRAKALIYFLALDDTKSYTLEKCKTVLNDGLIWKSVKSDSRWDRQGFTVTYKPWESHQITEAKQVEDGSLDNRRLDLEFLNRSVQIIVKGGDCWTKSVNDAGQSVEKPEVQSKSSEQ